MKKDLTGLVLSLETSTYQGTSLGNNFYKIRLAISSKGKGKSGGARIITFVQIIEQQVYLSAIYDKGAQSTITDKELKQLAELISSLHLGK